MSQEVVPKSFEDLIKDVHEPGLCGECGGCVSFCSADEISMNDIKNQLEKIEIFKIELFFIFLLF